MRTYKYLALALGLGMTALTSCHMDETPTTYLVTTDGDHAINSQLELQTMRNGIYSSFRSTFYGDMSQPSELMCDGFNATSDYGNNYGPVHRMDVSFTASDYDTEALWETFYSSIKDYNVFLHSAANFAEANPDYKGEADYYAGEAYCFRAYSYMELVRHYAKAYNASTASSDLGVPLVLEYNQSEKPARATVAKVYEQIKNDLDNATVLGIADMEGEVRSEWVTADVLNMLYARYYLDTKDYEHAAEYAEKVLASDAGYSLSADLTAMTNEYSKDNGTEAIFQLPASITENGSGTNSTYSNTAYYALLKNYGYPGNGVYLQPYFLPSQKLIDQYEENDLRYLQWFQTGDYTVYLSGYFLAGSTAVTTFTKYFGNPELTSDGTPNSRQHVKPFLIGEAYLIAAEAYFNAGDTEAAGEVLNELQQKRGATVTAVSEETIEKEWFRETVGEGLRISCLKRWGKGYEGREAQPLAANYGLVYGGSSYTKKVMPADDIHWVWPIPSYEMRINNNLVQNPGY